MEIEKREIEKKGKRLMKGDTNRKKCQAPPKTGDEKPPNRFGGLKTKKSQFYQYLAVLKFAEWIKLHEIKNR